jgi:hypothetical protein
MVAITRSLAALVLVALIVGVDAATPATPTRFAVIGDYGLAGPPAAAVAALVTSWAPDFILTTGDNNYYYGEASTIDANIGQYYHAFIAPYRGSYGRGAAVNQFFPALGNHDWETPGAAPYRQYFTLPGNERYYDVVRGPVHVFVLDSDFEEPDGVDVESVQAAWLQQRLAASSARWKVVTMHHPPYSSGPHGAAEWMQWPFEEWGADVVMAGHDHVYERITAGDFPYFVNGLGGASRYVFDPPIAGSQARYRDEHGAMLVEADDRHITFRFISRGGAVIDTYTLYSDPSAVAPAAPSGLTATAVSGAEVALAWADNASNEAVVVIEQAREGGSFTPVATVDRNVTVHEVSGLVPHTTYHFRVVARNAAGSSAPSPPATATTGAAAVPTAPTGLTARGVSPTEIALAWADTAANERGFVVEQAAGGAAFVPVASLPRDTTAYVAGALSWQLTYAFRVRAYNAHGSSSFSGIASSRTAFVDLVPRTLAGVPSVARPGQSIVLTTRAANEGTVAARSNQARFYLVKGTSAPILLGGKAGVSSLAAGAEVDAKGSVGVPKSAPPATYQVRVCLDDTRVVAEGDETNNCRLGAGTLLLALPDLVVVSLAEPPARARRGEAFGIRDEVKNAGVGPAESSTVRYYLALASRPGTLGPRLNGAHSVPSLAPGATFAKKASVRAPDGTPLGTYRVASCADDRQTSVETDETNNCRFSVGTIRIDP